MYTWFIWLHLFQLQGMHFHVSAMQHQHRFSQHMNYETLGNIQLKRLVYPYKRIPRSAIYRLVDLSYPG